MSSKKYLWAGLALAPLAIAPIAVVASCSSGTDVNKEDFQKAATNAKAFLESNSYLFKNQKPSAFNLSDDGGNAGLVLSPRQNYGFQTYVKTAAPRTDDDKNGTRMVELTLKRGNFSETTSLELKGFLTTSQEAAEADEKLKIENYLNLDTIGAPIESSRQDVKSVKKVSVLVDNYNDASKAPKAKEISKLLTKDKFLGLFKKEIGSEKDGGAFKTLFKQALDEKEVKLDLVGNPVQKVANGINAPIIVADVQLVKGEQKSSIVRVELGGFLVDEGFVTQSLLDQAATAYGNYYSPVKPKAEQGTDKYYGYLDKKASTLTTIDLLTAQLQSDWDTFGDTDVLPVPIQVKILSVSNQNDSRGSVTIKAEFTWKNANKPEVTSQKVTKDITLYGFQLV